MWWKIAATWLWGSFLLVILGLGLYINQIGGELLLTILSIPLLVSIVGAVIFAIAYMFATIWHNDYHTYDDH